MSITNLYFFFRVIKKNHVPETIVYDFLNDRLRAVRQDMTIQRLLPEQCLELLDPIIRFHVYFAYRYCILIKMVSLLCPCTLLTL